MANFIDVMFFPLGTLFLGGYVGYQFRILTDRRKEFNEALIPLRDALVKSEAISETMIADIEVKLGKRAKVIKDTYEHEFLPTMSQVDQMQKLDGWGRPSTDKDEREKGEALKKEAYANMLAKCELK
ncbi:hypothetical protein J8M20_04095 [Pseudoalteromonas luteoviolacea]|uniref:hypothetical protein n=1 Tax=Pseudoalteromonas luteoviolacea TaxID=43657 RepID=UPI001B38E885|nr:hypothetical protein [Pseudoalteromonas luteoviolacea]MBQ4810499.1 hypothetical protein [Pseudoalteromonas luteoviolacea]